VHAALTKAPVCPAFLAQRGAPVPIHPAFLQLGLSMQMGDSSIIGSNARCVALLTAFKLVRSKGR